MHSLKRQIHSLSASLGLIVSSVLTCRVIGLEPFWDAQICIFNKTEKIHFPFVMYALTVVLPGLAHCVLLNFLSTDDPSGTNNACDGIEVSHFSVMLYFCPVALHRDCCSVEQSVRAKNDDAKFIRAYYAMSNFALARIVPLNGVKYCENLWCGSLNGQCCQHSA